MANPHLIKVVPKTEKCILKNMQRAKNKAILKNKIGKLPRDIKIYDYNKTVCYMYKNKLTKTRIEFRNSPIYAVTWCMTKSTLHGSEQRRILSKYSSGSTHIHKGRKCTLILLHTIFKNNSRWLQNLSMKDKVRLIRDSSCLCNKDFKQTTKSTHRKGEIWYFGLYYIKDYS